MKRVRLAKKEAKLSIESRALNDKADLATNELTILPGTIRKLYLQSSKLNTDASIINPSEVKD